MKISQHPAHILQLPRGQILGIDEMSIDIAVYRERLPVPLPVVSPTAICQRHRAGKTMLTQEEEQVEFPFDLYLALHLVDLDDVLPFRGFDQVFARGRTLSRCTYAAEPRQTIIGSDLVEFPL